MSALMAAAEAVSEYAHPRPGRKAGPDVRDRGRGASVHRPQGTGEEFSVLYGLQAVRLRTDPQDDVFLRDGAAVSMVGLALRVTTGGRTHVEALAAGPCDGQRQFADRVGGFVVLRLRVNVAQDHRADLCHRDGLGRDLGDRLLAGFVE